MNARVNKTKKKIGENKAQHLETKHMIFALAD
jgi:hypothetical protein